MSWQADTVLEIKIVSAIVYSSKIQKGRFYLPMNSSLQQNVQYFEKYLPNRGPAGSDLPNRGPAGSDLPNRGPAGSDLPSRGPAGSDLPSRGPGRKASRPY